MALGDGVSTARLAARAVHDPLRDEHAIVRRRREDFMRVLVVALANAGFGTSLRAEVETRIDQILTVGEEEFHDSALRAGSVTVLSRRTNHRVTEGTEEYRIKTE